MIKMRALRQFSHTIYGTVSEGDVFESAEVYVDQFIETGLAVRVDAPKPAPVTEEQIQESAARVITSEQVPAPKQRRRRK